MSSGRIGRGLDSAARRAPVPRGGARETALLKRVRAFAHVDDPERAAAYCAWLSDDAPRTTTPTSALQAYGRMLFFSLWPDGGGFDSYGAGLGRPSQRARAARGSDEPWSGWACGDAEHVTQSRCRVELGMRPLRVHARYTREEIVAALDYVSIDGRKPNSFREGVLFAPAANADAFFVTLHKSEADYSPTTMYQDYAISPTCSTGSRSRARRLRQRPVSATSTTAPTAAMCCSSLAREGFEALRHGRALPLPRRGRLRRAPGERPIAITSPRGTFGLPPAADFRWPASCFGCGVVSRRGHLAPRRSPTVACEGRCRRCVGWGGLLSSSAGDPAVGSWRRQAR